MKRRLACLLRGWAHRLDPPPAEPVRYSTTMTQSFTVPASWTWNGTEWITTPVPQPPSLTVVR